MVSTADLVLPSLLMLIAVHQKLVTATQQVEEEDAAKWLDERGCCTNRKYNCTAPTSTACEADEYYHTCDITATLTVPYWRDLLEGTCITDTTLVQTSPAATNFSCFIRRILYAEQTAVVLMIENVELLRSCDHDKNRARDFKMECQYSNMYKKCAGNKITPTPQSVVSLNPTRTLPQLELTHIITGTSLPSDGRASLTHSVRSTPLNSLSNTVVPPTNTPGPGPTTNQGSVAIPALVSTGILLAVINLILVCVIYHCCCSPRTKDRKLHKTKTGMTMTVGKISMQENVIYGMNHNCEPIDPREHIYDTCFFSASGKQPALQ